MSHCIIIKFPYSSCVFDYFNLIKISVRNPPTFGGGVGGGGVCCQQELQNVIGDKDN